MPCLRSGSLTLLIYSQCPLQNLRTVRTPAQRDYTRLLNLLDDVASREVTAVLDELQVLTEPHVARTLAAMLPSGGPGLRCAALWHWAHVSAV